MPVLVYTDYGSVQEAYYYINEKYSGFTDNCYLESKRVTYWAYMPRGVN